VEANLTVEPRVAIILVNWNGWRDTVDCLASLRGLRYSNYYALVVENGSTDGSAARIRAHVPDVEMLELPRNLGFTGGNNAGIRHALARGADYILLLNNDTVVDRDLLTNLVRASRSRADGGILAAKILYFKDANVIWFAGAEWHEKWARFNHVGCHEVDGGSRFNESAETPYACGCALFASTAVFARVGLLHAPYFLLWEDSDWCYRARRFGYRSYVIPEAKVWHKVSSSIGLGATLEYYFWRNRLLWVERNVAMRASLRIYWVILKQFCHKVLDSLDYRKARGERRVAQSALAGVRDYFLRRFGPRRQAG
jgi:GT2 family glycosyltransferase